MTPRANHTILGKPETWQALLNDARQAWWAPVVVGAAWWNAALDAWLVMGDATHRHGGRDRPPLADPLPALRETTPSV